MSSMPPYYSGRTKFNPGDIVRNRNTRDVVEVKYVRGMYEYDKKNYPPDGFIYFDSLTGRESVVPEGAWELVSGSHTATAYNSQASMQALNQSMINAMMNKMSPILGVDNGEEKPKPKQKKKVQRRKKLQLKHLEALVISDTSKKEIISTLQQVENHNTIFKKWGLGEVIEYGRGMTFMFWGLPGTGKTYGANLIAKALGCELLTLSASEVQSSEPGGANRSIEQAFKTAKEKNKVLFIDECDSLIFNREQLGMVLASEVNTLLTCIEKFEGVCILATNRIADMDAALERRIALIVEFPMPNIEQRMKIWQNLLPKKLPLMDVNIEKLATYEISGGMIKNAVLAAARLAAAEKAISLTEAHFAVAIKRVLSSKNLMGTRKGQMAMIDKGSRTDKSINMFDDYLKK